MRHFHYQHPLTPKASFKISTTSMVFGKDLSENVNILADMLDHIEIVLFKTRELHNIPGDEEIEYLKRIGEQNNTSYSVHLPAFLEIASRNRFIREESIQLAVDIIRRMNTINPLHHILHIPLTPPTLTPEPGVYFYRNQGQQFKGWTLRALNSLKALKEKTGQGTKILVENINYSPLLLEPFLSNELCGLCLDLGHLLLGCENIMDTLKYYLDVTEEVHLHGVLDYQEHLSLSVLPGERVSKWVRFLWQIGYKGIVNLEVFTPGDLEESMNIMSEIISIVSKKN
jgi:sugar phosphate isomerase/epimerase